MPIAKLVSTPIADRAQGDSVLELAFLVSAGDGHLADEELAAFGELVGAVRGHGATKEEVAELLGGFLMNAQTIRGEDRIRELGPTIPGELREVAFKVAVGLTMVDDEASEQEDQLIGILAATLGLAERSIPLTAHRPRARSVRRLIVRRGLPTGLWPDALFLRQTSRRSVFAA